MKTNNVIRRNAQFNNALKTWTCLHRLLTTFACLCFCTSFTRAVTPPPDGGYRNENTAEGTGALFRLTSGLANTAVGFHALANTSNGTGNTAVGDRGLEVNLTGNDNTAIGTSALNSSNNDSRNTAVGSSAMESSFGGGSNVAVGNSALIHLSGDNNTAIGDSALGANPALSGSNNIAIGESAGVLHTSGDNNIYIGNPGLLGAESNTIWIGDCPTQANTYIAGIFGVTVPTGIPILIDSDCHLGTTTSSARFKDGIHAMDKASEAIFLLKPVSFRYKKTLDPAGISQFGLVAEEVEKVNPALVAYDKEGKPYSVRYEAVNAMLLNEFLKAHRRIGELEQKIAARDDKARQQEVSITGLQSEMKRLTAMLDHQALQIQKVSERLELKQPISTLAANHR